MSEKTGLQPKAPAVPLITNFKDLPAYAGLLSHGKAALVKLPDDKRREIVALNDGEGGFFLLSTARERSSISWYDVVNTLKQKGRKLRGQATVTPEIIDLVLYEEDHLSVEAVEQMQRDAAVMQGILAESAPIDWFKSTLAACMRLGASDVHFEVRGQTVQIRLRLDGIMRVMSSAPARVAVDGISACYNLMAQEGSRSEVAFNPAVAQVAMIPMTVASQMITLRFQSHPEVEGFDVILRILRSSRQAKGSSLSLDKLGYTPSQVKLLTEAVGTAWGGIFVAGVTGSGKTTTLNTMLTQLARAGNRKIISIEDPVEYQVDGVSHLSVQRLSSNASANPFQGAMMAFLRMDPDIGMFGEIRDALSAEMAMAAIQTGHKILTTVHATSAIGVVGRLTSKIVGLPRESVCNPEFISALVYQVLSPLNCPRCKVPAAEMMALEELQPFREVFGLDPSGFFCASNEGCPHCRKVGIDYTDTVRLGIKGVKVHAEVLVPDEDMLLLLIQGKDIEARRAWRARRKTPYNDPDMDGKEAWGHALYDMSQGILDPYYFELGFGSPKAFTGQAGSVVMPADEPLKLTSEH